MARRSMRTVGNLHQQVSKLLAQGILRGDYAEGTALPVEAELCATFGVSRTSLREAIEKLAAKRFIAVAPRQGAACCPPRTGTCSTTRSCSGGSTSASTAS